MLRSVLGLTSSSPTVMKVVGVFCAFFVRRFIALFCDKQRKVKHYFEGAGRV
jgi:hypothetical protein